MGRAGRKRSARARYRGGRLKPKAKEVEEHVHIARAQPHRRLLKSNDRISELAESSLGRLALRGIVSAAERAAGERFAGIVGAYRAVIEGPRPVRSLMPETTPERVKSDEELSARRFACPSEHADPIERKVTLAGQTISVREWPCQQPGEACACAERRTRYMRAYEAIAAVGRRAVMAVVAVAVRGEELLPSERVYLKRGLMAAAVHLGLTELDRRR